MRSQCPIPRMARREAASKRITWRHPTGRRTHLMVCVCESPNTNPVHSKQGKLCSINPAYAHDPATHRARRSAWLDHHKFLTPRPPCETSRQIPSMPPNGGLTCPCCSPNRKICSIKSSPPKLASVAQIYNMWVMTRGQTSAVLAALHEIIVWHSTPLTYVPSVQ